jgi:hypothetical protein
MIPGELLYILDAKRWYLLTEANADFDKPKLLSTPRYMIPLTISKS